MATMAVSGPWTRLRALGRGASGAEVFLATDDVSGETFAVKSVGAAGAALLRREQGMMDDLCSPHVVPCIGGGEGGDGSYYLFLEFAPGGSLADEVARNGGRLEEHAIRAYAADVARGLAYLHGRSLVHGDVKARNIVIGADGRAKLADFGCARTVDSLRPIGGTPAFMAPEVARGEEQGPAADVWALGCTVIEMATGHAPWSDMNDVVEAVHRIGYTDAVPEVPAWLSPEAKDFLDKCLRRHSSDRYTAAQLLDHAFMASTGCDVKLEAAMATWVSPKSTLDAAFWESESDDEVDEMPGSAAERIGALARPASALPDWDSDDGWIEVLSTPSEVGNTVKVSAEDMARMDGDVGSEELDGGVEFVDVGVDGGDLVHLSLNVGEVDATTEQERYLSWNVDSDKLSRQFVCNGNNAMEFGWAQNSLLLCVLFFYLHRSTILCKLLLQNSPFRQDAFESFLPPPSHAPMATTTQVHRVVRMH